ncbi:extracellular solute-binding protein [Paenibacillus sp. LMG 31456]|uniref:Extracellular solute-binding protein n=1 Tax=Paenibacillus foliorum TaxID=2654974 RepID=A0A972K4K1_9BACL|nr:ABC transporter substrate-binding protein [Paenibacillus foliorum]NOU97028.1 extracellular solute-binding protein [Paenibacillus foliorum]
MKKWIQRLGISMLAFSLTACGSSIPKNLTESSASIDNDSKIPSSIDKPVEVEFWHAMTGELAQALQKITTDFEAQSPNVKVKLVYQGSYTDLQQKLIAAAKANRSPALAQTYGDWNTSFVREGLLTDLTPYINDPKHGMSEAELNDIYPLLREENKWDGHYYSLPFNKSAPILFYNKTMLEQNNVKVPQTWDEWQVAASKLTRTKSDGKGKIYGSGFENGIVLESYNYVVQAGGEFYDETNQRLVFNSPEGRAGISFIRDMLQSGAARLAGEDGFLSEPFGRGDIAMYVGSSAGLSFVNKAVGGKFDWFAAVPPKGKKSVAYIQGTNVTVFGNLTEEQKLGAWNYIKFLINTENSAYWAQKTGYLPVRASVSQLDSYKAFLKANPVQGIAEKLLTADRFLIRIPSSTALEPVVSKEMEAILYGKKSVEQGLSDAEQAGNAIIAKALLNKK